jgi:hypothetical protein
VTDQSGAAVAGAQVEIKAVATGQVSNVTATPGADQAAAKMFRPCRGAFSTRALSIVSPRSALSA